ncbi:MAG: hypothetical protein V3T83_21125 [Acidobacteriota bacterium]
MAEMHTFKVRCAECEQVFHVRYPLADPEEEGSGEQVVNCLYCKKEVKFTLPVKYIGQVELLRSRSVQGSGSGSNDA